MSSSKSEEHTICLSAKRVMVPVWRLLFLPWTQETCAAGWRIGLTVPRARLCIAANVAAAPAEECNQHLTTPNVRKHLAPEITGLRVSEGATATCPHQARRQQQRSDHARSEHGSALL